MLISDLVKAIVQIRDVLDDIEVKGSQNSSRVVFIHDKCNALIAALNEIAKKAEEEAAAEQAKQEAAAAEQAKANESVKAETEEVCHEPDQ